MFDFSLKEHPTEQAASAAKPDSLAAASDEKPAGSVERSTGECRPAANSKQEELSAENAGQRTLELFSAVRTRPFPLKEIPGSAGNSAVL